MSKEEDQISHLPQSDGGSVPGPTDTKPESALGNTDTQSDGGSVPSSPDITPESALGNTDTKSDGGSVPSPPDTTPNSALGYTDTQSDRGSVPDPPDTTPESALGNTDTQSDGGSVLDPPDTTPESALGYTDTQSDGGSVTGPPDTTSESALGNTDTQSDGGSVTGPPDTTLNSTLGYTDTQSDRGSVPDPPDTTPESALGNTDTQSDRGSVTGPPDTTPDSALGNTDTKSDRGSVPGPPDTTPDSALGNTDTQSDRGSVPDPPDTTPESALGITDTQSDGGSVTGPPDTTSESALGNTDTQSDGGSVLDPPDTTPDSALGNTDTQSDRGSVPDPPDTTPDSALGIADTQSDGGSVPDPPDTTPNSALRNTDTQSDEGSVPGSPDTTPDSALGNTDTQSDGGSVPGPPDTTPDSALGNTDTQSDGGSVLDPPDTTPDSALGNTDTQSDGGSVPGPPDTRSDYTLRNTDTALQASTSRTALSSISDKLNENKPKKILSEKFLRSIAADIGKEWYLLSICLGLTHAEVERIQYDGTCDPETKIVKALLKWRSKSSHVSARAQLMELISALQENGRTDLADKYRKFLDETPLADVSVIETSGIENERIQTFMKQLFAINETEAERIPVSPLQMSSSLSVDEIYAPIYIKEDLKYRGKGRNIGRKFKPENEIKKVKHPNDIFYINNEELTRNIFLLGDAGHGKTVFCQKLLKYWCLAHQKKRTNKHAPFSDEWEDALSEFEFLFHVKLRHVDECRTSLIDMICHDVYERHPVCHEIIRQVLSRSSEKCLVIVDGLDEWKITHEAKSKLKVDGLPNLDGMGDSTILWTSRPWKFDDLIETISKKDKVLEVQGLDDTGIDILVDNILTHFYELELDSSEYNIRKEDINQKMKDQQIKDLLKIPLIAVTCIHIWIERKTVGKSITNFYINLIDLLISRALKKKDITMDDIEKIEHPSEEMNLDIQRFAGTDYALDILPVLEKLGEIAFDDLMSKEKNLVFRKRQLEKRLEKPILELALNVGLLTQCEAPGSFNEDKISVHFFHKSMQEFLAAFHVATGKVSFESFCSVLKVIQIVFELENMLMFICGLSSRDTNLLLRHIARICDSDKELKSYRVTFDHRYVEKAYMLCKLQLKFLHEIKHKEEAIETKQYIPDEVVTDVFLIEDNDFLYEGSTIQNTVDALLHHHVDVKCLTMIEVSADSASGISNQLFSDILDRLTSLESLHIIGSDAERSICRIYNIFHTLTSLTLWDLKITWDVLFDLRTALRSNESLKHLGLLMIQIADTEENEYELAPLSGLIQLLPSLSHLISLCIGPLGIQDEKRELAEVLCQLPHLQVFWYICRSYGDEDTNDDEYDALIASTLVVNCPMLQRLAIYSVFMHATSVQMNSQLKDIEIIDLNRVTMSEECWKIFILSLMEVNREVEVDLYETNISETCQIMISELPLFRITKSEIDEDKHFIFHFKKMKNQ